MKSLNMRAPLLSLATIAVVGSASAQSSFTIDGNVDIGYKSVTHTDSTKNKDEFVGNNSATSAVNFKGVKDLGNNLKASFLLEIDPNVAQSSTNNGTATSNAYNGTPFNGEEYVSLAGDFGQIKLGTPNAGAMVAGLTAQPFGTALGSGYSSGFGRLGTDAISGIIEFVGNSASSGRILRHEKTAMYTTPVFGGGFKGNIELALGNNNTATVTSNTNAYTGLSLQYNAGALNAIYSYTTVKAGANSAAAVAANIGATPTALLPANTTITWTMLAANYKFGDLTVYGGLTNTKHDGGLENSNSWNVAAKYAVSPKVDLMANYLVRDSSLAADADAKLIGLGANYDLGNATNLYFRWENLAFQATQQQQNTWSTGVRVQF